MTRMRREAQAILERYDLTNPPITLTPLLADLKKGIQEAKFTNDDIAGFYNYKTDKILINKKDSYKRQKFTLAHEIAHILFHQDYIKNNYQVCYRGTDYSRYTQEQITYEMEANEFAVNLLLPAKQFMCRYMKIQRLKFNREKTIDTLAKIFQASKDLVEYKLKNLGLD